MSNPTNDQMDALTRAYDHYNKELFGGRLTTCMVTMQRHRQAYGFYAPEGFRQRELTSGSRRKTTDEIAINPDTMNRPVDEVLSTLVHEMVHLWQEHEGKPGRGRYHNKQWADKMEEVGLIPSHTGMPGGRRTGDRMTHYIAAGGGFSVSTKRLLDSGWKLEWTGGGRPAPEKEKKISKVKFTCPDCEQNAWAKPTANLMCGSCQVDMNPPEDLDEDFLS